MNLIELWDKPPWNFGTNLTRFSMDLEEMSWNFGMNLERNPMELHGTLGPISWKLIEAHGIPWNLMELPEHSMAFSSEKVYNKLTYSSKDKRSCLSFGTLTLRRTPLSPHYPFPPPLPLYPLLLPLSPPFTPLSFRTVWLSDSQHHNTSAVTPFLCVEFGIRSVFTQCILPCR